MNNSLVAVPLPFRVPVAVPGIVVTYRENDELTVETDADFMDDSHVQDPWKQARVRLKFMGGFLRVSPPDNGMELVAGGRFDFSRIPLPKVSDKEGEYKEIIQTKWRETGFCPNPHIYYVENSTWVASLPLFNQEQVRHMLILGEDCYVEVISRRFSFERI